MRDPAKIDRHTAIHSLVGGNLKTSGENAEKVFYLDGQTPPTDEEIDAEVIRLQGEYDAQEYARKRASEYPSTGDQLDMIYKDNLNSTTTHKDAVAAVKTKWPKDNSGPVE
jgi:hypothetical protein